MIISSESDSNINRRKRIQRLKKLIIIIILLAILIPCILSIILGIHLQNANEEVKQLKEIIHELQLSKEKEAQGAFSTSVIVEAKKNEILQENEASLDEEQQKIYLTFDDGPSLNTGAILDVLKEYDVKATFFVVAKEEERYKEDYVRIVQEGHTLGMHSYSHRYDEIYRSVDSFKEDLSKIQEFLYDRTGVWPRYYRFPGGSSNTVSKVDIHDLISYLKQQDIMYFDWNVESGDTTNGKAGANRLVDNCMNKIQNKQDSVILMHDAADKDNTVKALPILIERIRDLDNTVLLPITDDTVSIQHLTNDDE